MDPVARLRHSATFINFFLLKINLLIISYDAAGDSSG